MSDSHVPINLAGSADIPSLPDAAGSGSVSQPSWAMRAAWGVLLLGLLGVYAVILSAWFVPAIQHPDANGYWAQATRIIQTGRSTFLPESDAQYIGTHWLLAPGGRYISRYPPGLPLVQGVLIGLVGPQAAVAIDPVLAVLTLLGAYLLAHELLAGVRDRSAWALVAVVLLAVSPTFIEHAFESISHMAVACCLVWGLVLLQKWASSGNRRWAFAAGLVLGCIPTIRYPDAVVAVGVGAFLLLTVWKFDRPWRHLLAAVGGAAVPILPLLIRNQIALGAFWKTGYSLTNEQTGFSLDNFKNHAIDYLQMLQGGGMGLLFGLGLIGMVWMPFIRGRRASAAMLWGVTVPLLLLYMAYYWAMGVGINAGAGGMRFLVPMVPIFAVAAAWTLATALASAPRSAQVVVPLAVVAVHLLMFGRDTRDILRRTLDTKRPLAMATAELTKTAADGDLVIAFPGLLQHLDFIGRWKLADPSLLSGVGGGMMMAAGPDEPSPMQADKRDARMALYTGSPPERTKKYLDDLRKYAGGKTVWLVASENDYRNVIPGVNEGQIEVVGRFSTPQPTFTDSAGGNGFGRRNARGMWRPPTRVGGGNPSPPPGDGGGFPGPPPGGPGGGPGARAGGANNPGQNWAARMRGGGGAFGRGLVAGQPFVIAEVHLDPPDVAKTP